jgi:hypothetical protein
MSDLSKMCSGVAAGATDLRSEVSALWDYEASLRHIRRRFIVV